MALKPDLDKSSPSTRAQKLVSYLEEKCQLPEDISENMQPCSLKQDITEIFVIAEETYKEIKESK